MNLNMNMTYKQAYVAAFATVHPNVDVTITGSNKRGLHKVTLNGDAGDRRLTENDVREATRMLQGHGPASLSAYMPGSKSSLQDIAKFVNK